MKPAKLNGAPVSRETLRERAARATAAGYAVPKWVEFCEHFLARGFEVRVYEARQTVSKYVTVVRGRVGFKVRFSNHLPNRRRELAGDCDFFVGKAHTTWTTTADAVAAAEAFFAAIDNPEE